MKRLTLLLALLSGCETRSGSDLLLTRRDYLVAGELGVERFIDAQPPHDRKRLLEAFASTTASSVFVERRSPLDEGPGFQSIAASGVFVDTALVVTIGGLADGLDRRSWLEGDDLQASLPDDLVLLTQAERPAERLAVGMLSRQERGRSDFALFHSVGDAEGRPSRPRLAEVGELAIAHSYPDGWARGPDGTPAPIDGSLTTIRPLRSVARVTSADPLELELVAGAQSLDGSQGAPFFGLDGRLLGILNMGELVLRDDGSSTERLFATPASAWSQR